MPSNGDIRIPNDQEEAQVIKSADESRKKRDESRKKREMGGLIKLAGDSSRRKREKKGESSYH